MQREEGVALIRAVGLDVTRLFALIAHAIAAGLFLRAVARHVATLAAFWQVSYLLWHGRRGAFGRKHTVIALLTRSTITTQMTISTTREALGS